MTRSAMPFTFDTKLRQRLADNLAGFAPVSVNDRGLRQAAVALVVVPLPQQPAEAAMLLTKRPSRLNRHAGQYALPGGKLDPGENPIEAAIRELDEELGLSLDEQSVLGVLDDYPTRSKFRITPVVLWGRENVTLVPSPAEVAEVFHIPFSELDSDAVPVFEAGVKADRPVLCSEFPTIGHRMYSPTASMMYQFREVAMRGQHTRVSHYDQPEFAWR